jgi:type IV secretory pathway VirB3-like protein
MLVGVACILDNVTFALVAVTLHAVAAICVLVDVAFDSVGVAFNFVGVG